MGEIPFERTGARVAPFRIRRRRAVDHAYEGGRQIRARVADGDGLSFRMPRDQLVDRRRTDGERIRDEAIQQDAETVEIRASAGRPAPQNLRREIQRRAGEIAGAGGSRTLALPSGAEIHQHDAAAVLAHDVLRFHVAMDQTAAVNGRERAAQLDADDRGFLGPERPPRAQLLLERVPLEQLHPQPHAAVVFRHSVHGDDVGMPKARRQRIRVGILRPQQLQRDVALELRIPRAVHVPERAAPEQLTKRERSPVADRRRSHGIPARLSRRRGRLPGRQAAMQLGESGDDAKLPQDAAVLRAGLRFDGVPVDRAAVGNRLRESKQCRLRRHGSSRGPAAGARG